MIDNDKPILPPVPGRGPHPRIDCRLIMWFGPSPRLLPWLPGNSPQVFTRRDHIDGMDCPHR